MLNIILAFVTISSLFILLWISAQVGRQIGRWQVEHDFNNKLKIISVAEGAVFALLGLFIAFAFSGAYDRFELRKMRIIDEVNAVETAYLRIDLLAPETQAGLRETLRAYLASRLSIYKELTELDAASDAVRNSAELRLKIWNQAIEACNTTASQAATMLFIPALNNLFEVANSRLAITKIHPPLGVFALLIGLALLSSFLAGYSTAKSKSYNRIYILSYIIITSLTIYIIMDLEFPRIGLIRVNAFDQLLEDVSKDLNEQALSHTNPP